MRPYAWRMSKGGNPMKKQLQSYIKALRDSGRNNWKEWCFGAILFAQRENMISFEDAEDLTGCLYDEEG